MALFLAIVLVVLALLAYWRFVLAVLLACLIALAIIGGMTVEASATTAPNGLGGTQQVGPAPQ